MRITYVAEKISRVGGMERILIDKMNYLAEHTGHEIILLLVWYDDHEPAYKLNPDIRIVKLNVPLVPKCITPKLLALYRFNKEIKKLSPDITVYTWTMGAFLSAFTSWKGKSIYESHLARHAMRNKWVLNRMEKKVDAVVTLTNGDADEFGRVGRTVVIPNFTKLAAPEEREYNSKHCIALGRFVYQKNFQRMIEIWNDVHNAYPDWVLDIYGEGEERSNIESLIRKRNLTDSVLLHDFTDNVKQCLADSSIYLMTSRFEGLPMVLIEAQTCGLPVIAFDCPYGPKDIVEDSKTGYLIPYNDDYAFTSKLSALMQNESLRQQMGENAKKTSVRYQPAPIMSQWLKLFHNIIDESAL